MKIGEEAYVHGYIDEIRNGVIIIRNKGGYFGTEPEEVFPSAEPERLTDDDFETIRIHLNAQKEKLCNQKRWEEAKEYQRIIDRFMAFVSAERKKGKWIYHEDWKNEGECYLECSECGMTVDTNWWFCPKCGADMRG